MGVPKSNRYCSAKEYLALEEIAEFKSEYYNGEIFAMSGGTANHDRLASECDRIIGTRLENGDCESFTSNMKVRIPKADIYFYPDFSVVCGQAEFEDAKKSILTNPILIVEVLSDSTESFDRGKKFHRYQQIPSLTEYLLISQTEPQVDIFHRSDNRIWTLRSYSGLESVIEIQTLNLEIKLADLYRRVEF